MQVEILKRIVYYVEFLLGEFRKLILVVLHNYAINSSLRHTVITVILR